MRLGTLTLALALVPAVAPASDPGARTAPNYTAASIVSLATGRAGELAPNTLAAIYGDNLATATRARQPSDVAAGTLPYVLPGTGVTVKVNGLLAGIEYVSPEAVVFIVPPDLVAGNATVVLTRNAQNGPGVKTTLKTVAPALLPLESGHPLARHAETMDWITAGNPAVADEEIILYATGLGPTAPPQTNRRLASEPSPLASELAVLIGDTAVDSADVSYVGVTEGTAGIYEIRLKLPASVGAGAEVLIRIGDAKSQSGMRLWVSETQPVESEAR